MQKNFSQIHKNWIVGVLDGHGQFGHLASQFTKQQLPFLIQTSYKTLAKTNKTTEKVITKKMMSYGFTETHKQMKAGRGKFDASFSGTTACVCIINSCLKTVLCGNAGDSRAVLFSQGDKGWKFNSISNDHKPDDPKEMARIIE